jgi:AraC-like DNA-binding protein
MKSQSIIVVETNAPFRKILSEHLRSNYHVRDFEFWQDAMAYMNTHQCHLVLYSVPDDRLHQEEFVKEVRKGGRLRHLPFITLLSREQAWLQRSYYVHGADMCLEKPFGLEFLQEVIATALRNREHAFLYSRRITLLPAEYSKIKMEDEFFVQKINRFIRGNIADVTMNVAALAEEMAVSVSQLDRRIFRLTGTTPKQYIRDYRMKVAYELLIDKCGNVSEVAQLTGFRSISYFSTRFKEHFGYNPSRFRFNKAKVAIKDNDFPPRVA